MLDPGSGAMAERAGPTASGLAWWAAMAATAELVLLRIGTRTLVHIPGADVRSGPLGWLAEVGRLAYYFSLVLVVSVAAAVLSRSWARGRSGRPAMVALALSGVASLLGVTGAVTPDAVGWVNLLALLCVAAGFSRAGRAAFPLVLWAAASWSAGLAVLLQGRGGGLTGDMVAGLLVGGDGLAVAAALTMPLLLNRRPSSGSVLLGVGVGAAVAALLAWLPSTTAILVLWAFGVTSALPPALYGFAAGAVVAAARGAYQEQRKTLAAAVLLVAVGGIGLISTYQTALVVTGLTLAGLELLKPPVAEPATLGVRPGTTSGIPAEVNSVL